MNALEPKPSKEGSKRPVNRKVVVGVVLVGIAVATVCLPLYWFVIRSHVAEPFVVQGPSMRPAYSEGDQVVASKATSQFNQGWWSS